MKIEIRGTGNQAPYGIGETMAIFPARNIRQIISFLDGFQGNPKPTLHDSETGDRYDLAVAYPERKIVLSKRER
jgi:hypothetical protein